MPGSSAPAVENTVDDTSPPLVELRGITKLYGSLAANNDVHLTIRSGDIHALLGENGAGKSTLVKILYGVVEPSAGEIFWQGEKTVISSPVEARNLGIGMVFQHFSLFDELTVAENIAVALSGDWSLTRVREEAKTIGETYGLTLDPDRGVWSLSAGERQRIEIVRCLLQKPNLLILDEPTSVLTPQESERLFETLNRLSAEGCAILYISHRLDEVRRLCRTATIMRAGEVVRTIDPRRSSSREIAAMMVGADIGEVRFTAAADNTREKLVVSHLFFRSEETHARALNNISFTVHAGEVFGIAGIAGNGQTELFDVLSGEQPTSPGAVIISGMPVGDRGIDERRKMHAAFVPEERLGHAAAPSHTLSENTLVSRKDDDMVRTGFVVFRLARRLARRVVSAFDVRVSDKDPEARTLSGGNLQKYIVGREIIAKPELLVVNQPTWGVDAGAARLIRQSLVDLSREGSAVVAISQDMDELFEISDRIAVLREGSLCPPRPTGAWTKESIGLEMLGQGGEGVSP
jgi:simple sugar transport system ATP-binding protein